MAAGAAAASGGSLEATLDRKFQHVTNTMDSIQGLSTWCIENKKYHSLIVRHWMKCLRKSDASHRLNLFYLANDVIQNCKRKNSIVYRTAFAEVLPDAFLVVNQDGDLKVIKAVERILSIWEERGVYSGTLISDLRSSLVKDESPPVTPVEQKTPVEADLRSKIVAEFVPQTLIDQLSKYTRSVEEVDLREKQLAAMRVDICSSDALKKLKDKAGGKRFSRDFEEGSAQLQEFVKFLDKQSKTGPALMQALKNADIFYEMQYKEVKIVANAYQTFANRVSHLKRKLDTLKSNLPDLDESPLPSPSADAPSPTGSESPFHGLELANLNPDLDGSAMDDEAEPPAPSPLSSVGGSPRPIMAPGENDNREVEDMDLSEEEIDSGGIIVEESQSASQAPKIPAPFPSRKEPPVATDQPLKQVVAPVAPPSAALESVDLSKIGSILNSLNSFTKSTGESPPAVAPAASSERTTSAASAASQDVSSLENILSKVDVSPAELLSALSKVQGQGSHEGIKSLVGSPATNVFADSSTGKIPPSPSSTSASVVPSQSLSLSYAPVPSSHSSNIKQSTSSQASIRTSNPASALVQALHRDMDLTTEPEPSPSSTSLESKIHSFLQGNPAFSAFDIGFSTNPVVGVDSFSPITGTVNQDGTPVRDEGGGTPTQDEIMDKPAVVPFTSNTNQPSIGETVRAASVAHQSSAQQNANITTQQGHLHAGVAQNGQAYEPHPYRKQEMSEHCITAPVAHYQQISAQQGGSVPGESALGNASGTLTFEGFQGMNERPWYSDTYPEGSSQHPRGYNTTAAGGAGTNPASGLYQYQTNQTQESQPFAAQQVTTSSDFFKTNLPPVPHVPPPPHGFEGSAAAAGSTVIPPQQRPGANTGDVSGRRVDSVISGMVVHDHQHKSMFHPNDPLYELDRRRPHHLEDIHPHPGDLHYQEDLEHFHHELPHQDALFFQDDPYRHPDDQYNRPGSPSHNPRGRGRLTPPLSPSEDNFYNPYKHLSPPPPHYTPRRPPPHLEIRHPGLRLPYRPPHLAHPPHPRGPPRVPFPRFHISDPRLRGKRPGPRGGGNPGPMFLPKRPFLPPRF